MAETEPETPLGSEARRPAFPRKMLILTVLSAIVIVLAFVFISDLEDWLGQGMDVVMVGSVFYSAFLMFLWLGWFLFFSRWKWGWRILASCTLVLIPIAFFKIFRPVNGGDATIVRFEPIWASRPDVAPVEITVDDSSAVDLKTETNEDYPRFLGPGQDAAVRGSGQIDADAFEQSSILWKQPIGRGWSGFAARNGYAVTMEQREEQECVTCYDTENGQLKWIYQHHARHQDQMNLGRIGPRSTPTIHNGRVYAVGAVGNFVCLDGANGEVVWQVNLNEILGVELTTETDPDGLMIQYEKDSALAWGRSGSPLIVGDLVVMPGGGPLAGPVVTLLAFDQTSGDLVWTSGTEMIAYGSPILATVAGIEQILLVAETKAMGFDAATGEELWDFPRPGETNGGANTSQLTVVNASQVLTSKGYPDGGGELIELAGESGTITPTRVWNNTRALKTKLMSPVLHEGHAYSLSNGFLECARLSDGERIWKRRGRFGHGQLLLVEDQILLHSESGTLFLISASSDGYEELGSLQTIDGVCWNTLCLHGDKLLVRSELEAACVQLPMMNH